MLKNLASGRPVCPFCDSERTVKHGRTKRTQRFRCRDCLKTFAKTYGTAFYRTKLKKGKLEMLSKCYENRLTVRAAASICCVNKNTALLWRFRMQETDRKIQAETRLSGSVSIDEKYVNVSADEMSVKTDGSRYKGISRNKLCIGVALDESGRHVFKVVGIGHPTSEAMLATWADVIEPGSEITHDGEHSHARLVERLRLKDVWIKAGPIRYSRELQKVNNDCQFIQLYLSQHPGILRKNLDRYLAQLSAFRERSKMKQSDRWRDNVTRNMRFSEYSTRKQLFRG